MFKFFKEFDIWAWVADKVPLPLLMTKFQIRKKFFYKDCPIYIIQFQNCFMRLFIFKGEAFQNHVFLKPSLSKYLQFLFRLTDVMYSESELKGMDEALLSESIKALDQLYEAGSLKKALKKKSP